MSFSILFPTNQYATISKSSEQIQRLLIPSGNHQQAMAYLIAKGTTAQLPFLYSTFHLCFRSVLPFVCSRAPQETNQNQLLIAQTFRKVLESQQATNRELSSMLDVCIECLGSLQGGASEQMASLLTEIIRRYTDQAQLIKRMQAKALMLGKSNQPIIERIMASRIISVLSQYAPSLKSEMVQTLKKLCNEPQIQARRVFLMEIFPKLLYQLDLQFIELHFQQKIYEFVWGENQEIGRIALQTIFKHLHKFSIEEQSTRIVKLFIDSLTSKNEKIALMTTEMMGEIFQKLQGIIFNNENNCTRFWKSFIEISITKNEKIVNNYLYNFFGILSLSAQYIKLDPICDLYISFFYSILTDKLLLVSYFHEMIRLFPLKIGEFKQIVLGIFNEFLTDEDTTQESFKIVNKIISQFPLFSSIFMDERREQSSRQLDLQPKKYLQDSLCTIILNLYNKFTVKKVSKWIINLLQLISQCSNQFTPYFIEHSLLPQLYFSLRAKTYGESLITEIIVKLIARDTNSQLINTYISKFTNEMSKSLRSFQRQIAILFYYQASIYFSIQLFRQYKIGQKYLSMNNDKNFKVQSSFIINLPRVFYFLDRQQRVEYSIIVSKLLKETDPLISAIINQIDFKQNERQSKKILISSQCLREKQQMKMASCGTKRNLILMGRSSKDLRKEQVLKKRLQSAKTKLKGLAKEFPKKKLTPLLIKTNSNFHFQKRV